jgi:hypothetical protein
MLFRRRIMGLVLGLAVIISTLTAYSKEIEWTKVSVPNTTSLKNVAISSDASVIYVTDSTGGLNKTTDNGKTWIQLNPSPLINGSYPIPYDVVCSSDGSIVYVAYTLHWPELYKSSDYGATWSLLEFPHSESYIMAISDNGNIVYIAYPGYYNKIFKSPDGGINWIELTPSGENTNYSAVVCSADGSKVVVSSQVGTCISDDGGNSWSTKELYGGRPTNISVSPNSEVIGYNLDNNVIFSFDSFESYSISWVGEVIPVYGHSDSRLSLSYDGSVALLAGLGRIFISTDSLNTWKQYYINDFHLSTEYNILNPSDKRYGSISGTTYNGNKVFFCGYHYNLPGHYVDGGILLIGEIPPSSYTVTFVEGANGTITGNKVQTVNEGLNCTTVTAVPNMGYHFVSWSGDYTGPANPLTYSNVLGDMTITANFEHNTATLTVNKTGNGSSGFIGANPLNNATFIPITANAETNNHFVKWTLTSGSATIANPNLPDTEVMLTGGHGSTATVTASFATGKLPVTVNITGLKRTYTGAPCPVTVTTVPAGLEVYITYNGAPNEPINAGSYAVTATVVNDNYAGTKTGSLVIAKASQTINFSVLPSNLKYGDDDYPLGATATSELPVIYTSSNLKVATITPDGKLHIVGAGKSNITAKQVGDANWKAATPVAKALIIGKKNQTIDFPEFGNHSKGEPDFLPGATTDSSLTITYTSSNCSVATIVKGKIHIVGKGSAIVTTKQTGNTNWNVASLVTQTLTVD